MRSGCYCQVRLVQKQTKPPKRLNNTPGPPPPLTQIFHCHCFQFHPGNGKFGLGGGGGGGPGVLLSRFGGLVCFCTSLTWHYSPLRRQALCKNVGVKTCIMGNVKILHSLSHTTGMSPFLPLLHFFILHFSYFLPSFCAIYVGCQTIKWYAPCS